MEALNLPWFSTRPPPHDPSLSALLRALENCPTASTAQSHRSRLKSRLVAPGLDHCKVGVEIPTHPAVSISTAMAGTIHFKLLLLSSRRRVVVFARVSNGRDSPVRSAPTSANTALRA